MINLLIRFLRWLLHPEYRDTAPRIDITNDRLYNFHQIERSRKINDV